MSHRFAEVRARSRGDGDGRSRSRRREAAGKDERRGARGGDRGVARVREVDRGARRTSRVGHPRGPRPRSRGGRGLPRIAGTRGRPSPRPRAPPAAGRFRPPRSRAGRRPRSSGGSAARPPSRESRARNARGRGGEECADERDPRTLSDARPRGARGNDPIQRRRPLGLKEQASRRDGARANFAVSSRRAGVSRRGARTRLLLFLCSTPRSSAHDAARGARLSGSLGRSPRPSRSLLFTRPPLTSPSTRALRRWLTRGARALASGARVGIRGGIPEAPSAPPTGRPAPWRYTSKLSAWS